MKTLFRKFIVDENGGPLIEFTFTALLIAASIPAMIDLATLVNGSMKLSGGMRAGTQYAVKNQSDNSGIAQAIASASNLSSSNLTVTTAQFCECNASSVSCSQTCSGGYYLAKYVNVTASYNISGQYNYQSMPYPSTISQTVSVRIQ